MLRTALPTQPHFNVITETPDLAESKSQLPQEMPRVSLSGVNNSLSAFSYQESRNTGAEIHHLRLIRNGQDGLAAVDQVIPLYRDDYKRVIGIFHLCQEESIDIGSANRDPEGRSIPSERERAIFDKLNIFVSCLTMIAQSPENPDASDLIIAGYVNGFLTHSDAALFYRTKS